MNIIASIHDKWLQKIKSGEKTVEVRKTTPKEISNIGFIYWYNTKSKSIEGFSILLGQIICPPNSRLLDIGFKSTCLSQEEFDSYSKEKTTYHWELREYISIEQIKLPNHKRSPQSWCYWNTIFPDTESHEDLEVCCECKCLGVDFKLVDEVHHDYACESCWQDNYSR